jgi:hypothetical protein
MGSARSYLGAPTSNVYFTPTPDSSGNVGFAVNGTGTFKRVLQGRYGGYDIQATDVVYRYDLGGLGCHYHGNDYNVPSGYYVTFAFDYYISPGAGSYPVTNYLANIENGGNGISASTGDYDSTTGVWKRAVMSPNTTSNGSGFSRFLLYPGACGDGVSCCRLATSGYILYKNPQAELRSFSTSYIPTGASSTGSRSVTSSLFDFTGNYNIDLTSAGYDSSGNLTFNAASSNYILAGTGFSNFTAGITGEFWAKFTASSYTWERLMDFGTGQGANNIIFCRYAGSNSLWLEIYNGSNTSLLGFQATDQITNGGFGHYVFTIDGSIARIYKNGVQVASSSTSVVPTVINRTNTYIGRSNWSADSYFQGSIPVARLYNRALTSTEIMNNYNASKGRFGLL